MKVNTKIAILSAAGFLLSAGNALAAAGNVSSTDVVGNLGFFSTLAGTIMTYSKYVAFFMAIISLLVVVQKILISKQIFSFTSKNIKKQNISQITSRFRQLFRITGL